MSTCTNHFSSYWEQAIFIAHGPSFKKGEVVEHFQNIELYGMMAGELFFLSLFIFLHALQLTFTFDGISALKHIRIHKHTHTHTHRQTTYFIITIQILLLKLGV